MNVIHSTAANRTRQISVDRSLLSSLRDHGVAGPAVLATVLVLGEEAALAVLALLPLGLD